jgi:hypothetical protein
LHNQDQSNGLSAEQVTLKDLAPTMAAMSQQIARILAHPRSPFFLRPPPGELRGIDVYPASALMKLISSAAFRYKQFHGALPNLVEPARLTEKIYWANYFRLLKIPETGNKLATASFLPAAAATDIAVPEVVWRSREARLPTSSALPKGIYYLKTNHGSDMFRRVAWPPKPAERKSLEQEFAGHLARPYGFSRGEWWYSRFDHELFLERSVASETHPIAWCCYTFHGEVGLVVAYRKLEGESDTIWLNPDFSPSQWQNPGKRRTQFITPSAATRIKMLNAARQIGRPFAFVRVDFLLGDAEEIYLSEMTFSPGNATTPLPLDLDLKLGAMWKMDWLAPPA